MLLTKSCLCRWCHSSGTKLKVLASLACSSCCMHWCRNIAVCSSVACTSWSRLKDLTSTECLTLWHAVPYHFPLFKPSLKLFQSALPTWAQKFISPSEKGASHQATAGLVPCRPSCSQKTVRATYWSAGSAYFSHCCSLILEGQRKTIPVPPDPLTNCQDPEVSFDHQLYCCIHEKAVMDK